MTFREFTLKFRGTINPATTKQWTLDEILTQSGLSEIEVKEYVDFWDTLQRIRVAQSNKMPSNEDIILAHDGPLPTITLELPKPAPPVIDRTKLPRTPYNPSGLVFVSQLTLPQFEDLMIHILKEHFPS